MMSRVPGRAEVPAEKLFLEVNGTPQGMFVTRSDPSLPVLLHLHGGMPEFFLERKHPSGLERLFTVVWWEQRGSGLSYRPRDHGRTITADRLVDDTLALARTLAARFDRPRVYLMGHSGGTFIGIRAAARAPELFHAYIGVAQISNQLESEVRAHRFMLAESLRRGEKALARRLHGALVSRESGLSPEYLRVRDAAMHRLGVGTMRSMDSVLGGVFLPSIRCRDYTWAERARLWIAKARSGPGAIWDEVLATDLREAVPRVDVPVHLLHGVHDRTCSYELAREYFRHLTAPRKGFYTFRHSAHSPHFEEPARTRRILREDVLGERTALADR